MDTEDNLSAPLDALSEYTSFPIVGIGASAGGLESFISLLEHLPATTGMAYVLVQHLDPTHESILPSLLARVATMPVTEVRHQLRAEADQIYVIPPGTDMMIDHGVFTLAPRKATHGQHLSIDLFLRSLATSLRSQAIGVILSGLASDGTLGLQAIKEAGGMTFAQDSSARYNGMPHSAITSGYVDMILPPDQIAQELTRLSHHAYLWPGRVTDTAEVSREREPAFPERERAFQQILRLLRHKTGVDFTMYKMTTLRRRVLRRMAISQVENLAEYLTVLQDRQEEIEALYRDVLITVTSFFRDPATFALLTREVLPRLIEQKRPGAAIRIWVPGCSTGEEVYSFTICLLEFFTERSFSPSSIQVFGTDLHPTAIERARAGIYPQSALLDVEPARLARFFSQVNGSYQINKAIRDLCVFAQQNVCQDPPFSRLDLLSCRNVLIYLEPLAQHKVLETFHYALNPGGTLVLGSSETVGRASDLFTPIEQKQSVYMKKQTVQHLPRPASHLPVPPDREEENSAHVGRSRLSEERVRGGDVLKEADHLLLSRYAPASVVIDAQMEILQFRGHTSPYLEAAAGRASFNLLKMARTGLGLELRTAIHKASKSGIAVKKTGIPLLGSGPDETDHLVTVEVIPLRALAADPCFLILFENTLTSIPPVPQASQITAFPKPRVQRGAKDRRIQQLEMELATTRQEMQAIIEELEASNEECQSINEEILSGNEELQSVNEELETSKEEIQSTNEELLIINQELQQRHEEIIAARDYAEAILETVREPLLILNADLRVLRANRAFYLYFQVEPSETEQRPFYELGDNQWNIAQLRDLLEEILPQNTTFQDFEVENLFPLIGYKTFLLNGRRLAGKGLRPAQILLAFEDMTGRKELERKELERRKDEFIAMAAHELKTPVTSIMAYVHLLQRRLNTQDKEQARLMLTKIETQLGLLTRLISELLDVTHMTTGILSWQEERFDLKELVQEVVEDIGRTTDLHQIRLEGGGQVQIQADRERIVQVLSNLLTNAIKYTPQGGSIVVRQTVEEHQVTLSVQDHGIGIPLESMAHLFERFYRVRSPKYETFPGLGLGLYLCSEIVKRQGERIWVESQPGIGSTFFVTLQIRSELDITKGIEV